jgi:hypothetical protein
LAHRGGTLLAFARLGLEPHDPCLKRRHLLPTDRGQLFPNAADGGEGRVREGLGIGCLLIEVGEAVGDERRDLNHAGVLQGAAGTAIMSPPSRPAASRSQTGATPGAARTSAPGYGSF